jgi:parvulin-like peptidyl-prolyl isomerase
VDLKPLRLIAVSVVAAVLFTACGSSEPAPAATVGGTDITDAQLAKEAKMFTFLLALSQQPCGGAAPEGQSQEAVCNRFALSNMIQERLVSEYADANGVAVTDKEISDIIARLDGQLGKDAVDEQLGKLKLTRTDLEQLARQVLLFQAVKAKVVENELGGPDKIRALYESQILQYTTVQFEHILVDTQAEAEDVYQQVTAPGATAETFHTLAKQVSTDTTSARNGGSLGSAVASTYVPEVGEAAAALEPGEISQPVKSDFGWHVIRMVTKTVTPFKDAKPQLIEGQSLVIFNDWVRAQLKEGGLEVNPKYGRFDTDTLTVVVNDSTDPSATTAPAPGQPTPVNASPTP